MMMAVHLDERRLVPINVQDAVGEWSGDEQTRLAADVVHSERHRLAVVDHEVGNGEVIRALGQSPVLIVADHTDTGGGIVVKPFLEFTHTDRVRHCRIQISLVREAWAYHACGQRSGPPGPANIVKVPDVGLMRCARISIALNHVEMMYA